MLEAADDDPGPERLRELLRDARRIAVVGLSPDPRRDSHRVARYLLAHGYEVLPVYPREDRILEQPVFRRVQDIPGHIDIVDVFRRSAELPGVVDDLLRAARRPGAVWFQLDCVHAEAARRAREAGVSVVMDRCIMVDHAQLLGR